MSDKKCPNCGYELDSWNDCVSVNNILECPECEEHFELKAVTLNEPQLTIPKSIAEMLDKEIAADAVTKFAMFHEGFERFWLSYELQMYCAKKKDYALVSAYLAGKALGVDLAKVVE